MQAVGGQLLAQDVRSLLGEEREEVDEVDLLLAGQLPEEGIDLGNRFGLARQQAVAAETLVDGQQALQVEVRLRRLAADALHGEADEAGDAVGRQSVGHVVDAYQQEQFPGMAGQNLVQAVVHAHHLVADDAAVHHVFPAEPLAPVASVLGQAVAQHHNVLRGDGRFVHELEEAPVVMVGIGARGGLDGGGHGIGHQRTQAHHAVLVLGMDGVDEQDDAGVRIGVNDDAGAGVARVAVGMGAEEVAVVRGIGREAVPSQRASQRRHGTGHGAHGLYALRAEDAPSVPLAAVLQGGAEQGDVIGTREDTCVAADATVHDAGQGVVHLSAEHLSVGLLFGGGHEAGTVLCPLGHVVGVHPVAVLVLPAGQVVGVFHAQHVEDVLFGKLAQRLAADGLDDVLQGDEVEAAVLEVGLRAEVARAGGDVFHQSVRIRLAVLSGDLGYRRIGRQSRGMSHQVLYADGLLFLAVGALPVFEVGDVAADGVEHAQLALFGQYHDGDGGRHGLAARSHVEHGVGGHRFHFGQQAPVSVGLEIGHLAVADDGKHGSRNAVFGNGLFDGPVGIRQVAAAHAHLFGGYPLQGLGRSCLDAHEQDE